MAHVRLVLTTRSLCGLLVQSCMAHIPHHAASSCCHVAILFQIINIINAPAALVDSRVDKKGQDDATWTRASVGDGL